MAIVPIDARGVLALRAAILDKGQAIAAPASAPVPDFADALRGAVGAVNRVQTQAGAAATAFERGETTDIAAVMIARQKASIAFEATLQVRNKLLTAYRDIMNMPV